MKKYIDRMETTVAGYVEAAELAPGSAVGAAAESAGDALDHLLLKGNQILNGRSADMAAPTADYLLALKDADDACGGRINNEVIVQ